MSFLDLIFPRKCFGCGKEGGYICASCARKLEPARAICPRCEKASIDGMVHVKCKKPLGLDGVTSVWTYDGAVRRAIISLKYKFASDIANELMERAIHELKTRDSLFIIPASPAGRHNSNALVPIPLHLKRKNWRGFNQTEILGKLIAKGMNWKFEPGLLTRNKATVSQAGLSAKARTENIQGVFAISPSILVSKYPSIILFDDVWTTGSTVREACKVLKRAGAADVWALTIAR